MRASVRRFIDKLRLTVARSTSRWAARVLAEHGDVVGLASADDSPTEAAPETGDDPPAHWLEMVRARAPQLLRDVVCFGAAQSLADVRWAALSSLGEAPVRGGPRADSDGPTRWDLERMTSLDLGCAGVDDGQRTEALASRTPAAPVSSERNPDPRSPELSHEAAPSSRPAARRSANAAPEPPLLCRRSAADDLVALAPSPPARSSRALMTSDLEAAPGVTSPPHVPPDHPSPSRAPASDHAGATDAAAAADHRARQTTSAARALADAVPLAEPPRNVKRNWPPTMMRAESETARGSASRPSPPSQTTLWPQLPDEVDTPVMQPSWPALPVEDLLAALDPVDYDELERRARLRGEQQGARWSEPRF